MFTVLICADAFLCVIIALLVDANLVSATMRGLKLGLQATAALFGAGIFVPGLSRVVIALLVLLMIILAAIIALELYQRRQ